MSNKTFSTLFLAGLVCAMSSSVLAGGGRLAEYDTNGDGTVTDDEIIAARTADFEAGDIDNSDSLSLMEFNNLKSTIRTRRIQAAFDETDSDDSSGISLTEFTTRARSNNTTYLTNVFNLADADNNELLDIDEFSNLRDRGENSGIWGFARLDTDANEAISLAEYTTIRRRGRR